MIRCLLLLALLLGATQCASRSVVYTPEDWPARLKADLYEPPQSKPPAPVVILVHGTGWFTTDQRWQMQGLARKLAKHGYFVMNLTYRMSPEWGYPAPVDDLGKALDWIDANAAANNLDRKRVALFGYSAGGHLVLLRGLRDHRVKAIVAGAAPADLMWFDGGKLVEAFIGGTRAQYPEVYREASPIHLVRRGSPPVFLYHGGNDSLIPPVHALAMKDALDRAHVPNELYILEGKTHVTAYLQSGPAEIRAISFLDRHLKKGRDERPARP